MDLANPMNKLQNEIERINGLISAPASRKLQKQGIEKAKPVPMRNASSMMLIDGSPDNFKILMGVRNKNLKFMPGALVFPGGRVDPGDGYIKPIDELHPKTEAKLLNAMRGKPSAHKARAFGLAAIRETAEEAGLLLGKNASFKTKKDDWKLFEEKGVSPSLANLRLISRAITPPGSPRRFDTWFFACHIDNIGYVPENEFDPSGELEDLCWISPQEAMEANTREITRVMLVELMNRLREDPALSPDYPTPYYFVKRGKFTRDEI